jgi:hypothetical protein
MHLSRNVQGVADQSERRFGVPEIVRAFKTFSACRVNERAGKLGATDGQAANATTSMC